MTTCSTPGTILTDLPDGSAAKALLAFLQEHGAMKPKFTVSFIGSHTERRTRTVYRDGRSHTETYTVTIIDFTFKIDLTHYILPDPIFWSSSDVEPVYRGTMREATEPNGPVNVERRQLQEGEVVDQQEAWETRRAYREYLKLLSSMAIPFYLIYAHSRPSSVVDR